MVYLRTCPYIRKDKYKFLFITDTESEFGALNWKIRSLNSLNTIVGIDDCDFLRSR